MHCLSTGCGLKVMRFRSCVKACLMSIGFMMSTLIQWCSDIGQVSDTFYTFHNFWKHLTLLPCASNEMNIVCVGPTCIWVISPELVYVHIESKYNKLFSHKGNNI